MVIDSLTVLSGRALVLSFSDLLNEPIRFVLINASGELFAWAVVTVSESGAITGVCLTLWM